VNRGVGDGLEDLLKDLTVLGISYRLKRGTVVISLVNWVFIDLE